VNICMLSPTHEMWDPRVVMRESCSLVKAGHRVALVAMSNESREFVEGVELLPAPKVNTSSRWQRLLAMGRVYCLGRKWPADVYHAHEVESLAVGILLKWRTGAKLIWDSHECFQFTAARNLYGWKAKLVTAFVARILRWMSKFADHIIVVSFSNERFYRQFCGRDDVTIIHNSPSPGLFVCDNKPQDAAITITNCGRLGINRGMMQLLEALAIVKEKTPVKFMHIGTFARPDMELKQFERKVKDLGLENETEVTGWVSYKTMAQMLNRGSIGLVTHQPTPNNYSTLHNRTFSYMCTGQAVIGPKGSDTEQLIRETNCGLAVDMTDPQVLAEAMIYLIENPENCKQMGLNGRKAIEETFGWHIMEKLLWAIYEDLEQYPK